MSTYHSGSIMFISIWMLFTGAISYKYSRFGSGTGPALIDSVSCTGNEQFVANCTNRGLGVTSSRCTHTRNAGVRCPGD